MPDIYLLIILCALITYTVRAGGYAMMAYFGKVHHRVEAALDAVPIAVLSALVAPTIVTGHWTDVAALIVVCLASLRLSLLPSLILGIAILVALRHMFVF